MLKGDGVGKQDAKVNCQTWLKKMRQRKEDSREQAVTRTCKSKMGKGRNSTEETSKTLLMHTQEVSAQLLRAEKKSKL